MVEQSRATPGRTSATCRTISEPIQPPPPVTSTRLPVSMAAIGSRSMSDRRPAEQVFDVELADVAEPRHAVHPRSRCCAAPGRARRRCRRRRRPAARGRGGASGTASRTWSTRYALMTSTQPVDASVDGNAVDRAPTRGTRRRRRRPRAAGRGGGSRASPAWRTAASLPEPTTATRTPVPCRFERRNANSRDWKRTSPNRNVARNGPDDHHREREPVRRAKPKIASSTASVTAPAVKSRRASSMLACRHVRPYPPHASVASTWTMHAIGTNTRKFDQYRRRHREVEAQHHQERVGDERHHDVEQHERDVAPHLARGARERAG